MTETAVAAPSNDPPGLGTTVARFGRLRWRLLRNVLRTDGSQKWAVVLGLVAALAAGTASGIAMAVAGRTIDDPGSLFVIWSAGIAVFVVVVGVVAGIAQPVDPRVLATEPITDRDLGIGLLAASAVGPPGLAAGLVGIGMVIGAVRGPLSVIPVVLATASFLATLLLISRSTINALGLFATRFPRAGQIAVGIASLVLYGGLQLVSSLSSVWADEARRATLADALTWTPMGQLGRALEAAGDQPLVALAHVGAGSLWLVPLAWVFVVTTQRLIVATPPATARNVTERGEQPGVARRNVRRLCGHGAIGAIAWRSLLTRLRTPRTALETFIGAGVGLAIVLVPALLRDEPGAGAVIVGGAVQFAVLFVAGNSFGSDGPPIAHELLAGLDPAVMVRAKARSVAVLGIPIAVVGPAIAAGVTGEWRFFPAGLLVGFGGLLAGTGGAIVQSTLVPIAIPESDNPLASGDTGKGCLAGVVLAAVLIALAVVTLPVALALLWAVDRQSVPLTTAFAVATLLAGAVVYELGVRYASGQWRRKEPEIYEAIVPAR